MATTFATSHMSFFTCLANILLLLARFSCQQDNKNIKNHSKEGSIPTSTLRNIKPGQISQASAAVILETHYFACIPHPVKT
jgi:hypothetical protein